MSPRKAWIVYTVLRILFFAVPFAALMLIGWEGWLAAITATLVAVSLSMILLSKPRETAAETIYDWRNRDRTHDDIVEDDVIDEATNAVADQAGDEAPDALPTEHPAERPEE